MIGRVAWLALCSSCFYVTEGERVDRWDLDGDGSERPLDCDDDDPALSELKTYFADTDGDGFGDPGAPTAACDLPEGFVDDDTDCDDSDALSFPGAAERCDNADNDCNQQVDEGLSQLTWYQDLDNDGAGTDLESVEDCDRPDGYAPTSDDCDDTNPDVNPNAIEICNDGVDDDCDDRDDELDPDLVPPFWYEDFDGDTFGRTIGGVQQCDAPAPTWVDNDLDCDDLLATVNPDAEEVCNGIDDDCFDGVDIGASDTLQYYPDTDLDLYGDKYAIPLDSCEVTPPPGYVTNLADCDDSRIDVNPGLLDCASVVDGVDNDCSGVADDDGC